MARSGRMRFFTGPLVAAILFLAPSVASPQAAMVPLPPQPAGVPFPTEAWPEGPLPPGVDPETVTAAVDALMVQAEGARHPDARAVLVVHGGRIVVERYADGFGRDSRFQSWSVAKSFTHALAGILVRRGKLTLDGPLGVPEWQGDERRAITLRQMLNMSSGVDNADWKKGLDGQDLVGKMLFGEGSGAAAAYASDAPLAHAPGSFFAYSTGTTAIVAAAIGRAAGDDATARQAFIQRELFDRLGMRSAVFEFDRSGHFLGGSHLWACARDYARLGLLYLRAGHWGSEAVVTPEWVDFARTRAPAANNHNYGAHFWLNTATDDGSPPFPGAPGSAFAARGRNLQDVVMVPTLDLVVVRLGESHATTREAHGRHMGALIAAFSHARAAGDAPASAADAGVADGGAQ